MRRQLIAAAAAAILVLGGTVTARAAGGGGEIKAHDWSFSGVFGTFDRGALQRGYQVYKEVCASCHSMNLLYYRNLTEIGLNEDQVKEIAAEYEVADGPDGEGEMFMRPAKPSDRFVAPFANEQAARASNNGANPPDLSLIVEARFDGPDYIYSLLTGYEDEAPEGVELGEGMNYNHAFPGNQIAMAPPLFEGAVEYADGTEATLEQMAEDVTTFLTWAAEPMLETRKRMGVKVILFLIVLSALLYAVKRKVWSDLH